MLRLSRKPTGTLLCRNLLLRPQRKQLSSLTAAILTAASAGAAGYLARSWWPKRKPADSADKHDDHYSLASYSITRYTAADTQALQKTVQTRLEQLPEVAKVRSSPDYEQVSAYWPLLEEEKQHHLTMHTLNGPSRFIVEPLIFQHHLVDSNSIPFSSDRPSVIGFTHVGRSLCGHYGILHGGAVATLFDESLGRAALHIAPRKTLSTANLEIDYRSPVTADQFIEMRSWPVNHLSVASPDSRKILVQGEIWSTTHPRVKLAEGKAVFVVPKSAMKEEASVNGKQQFAPLDGRNC